MSFLAVDLKFVEMEGPAVARAAGVSEDRVLAGSLRLWKMCWAQKRVSVTRGELAGCFGGERLDDLLVALEEHLLEPELHGDERQPMWRVRGADKYLRVSEARAKGGRAASANLKRGNRPGMSREPAGKQPEVSPGSFPGLTPNTEHRTPSIPSASQTGARLPLALVGEEPPKPKTPKRRESTEGDPRHQPLVDGLCATFERVVARKYPFAPRDAVAVKALLTSGYDPPAIIAAWARALRHRGYPTVGTLTEFHDKLAHFIASKPDARATADPASGWSGTGDVTVTRMEPPP